MFDYERRRLQTAIDDFNRKRAMLQRPDGSRKYADPEYNERINQLLNEFDEATAPLIKLADDTLVEVDRDLAVVGGQGPIDRLTSEELTAANVRQVFVKEDVERLPVVDLIRRAHFALKAGSRTDLFLFDRYLMERCNSERQKLGPGHPDYLALDSVTAEIRTTMADPDVEKRKGELESRRNSAWGLRNGVDAARRDLDGTTARAEARMRASIGF